MTRREKRRHIVQIDRGRDDWLLFFLALLLVAVMTAPLFMMAWRMG